MKEVCGVNSVNPEGLSKSLAGGGFSALLVGDLYNGSSTNNFGYNAFFWSSSTFNPTNVWSRNLNLHRAEMEHAAGAVRCSLYSVRCKKD
jgi:uncharacterized protein (TIGR02145 family)